MEKLEILKDLAAAFRWTAKLNMHEAIANHFSVCAPNSNEDFYVNGTGMHFSSIKASDLFLVEQSKINELKNKPELVDPTALHIHGSIHKKVPHAKCILHVHSKYATALAALEDPTLPPIDQNTMRFFNRVGVYRDFGGMGFEEESEKMASKIGNKKVLLMSNHGGLTTGQTVAEAFDELYYFERACKTYILALQTGKPLRIISDEIAEKVARQIDNFSGDDSNHFNEIKLILGKEGSDYAT